MSETTIVQRMAATDFQTLHAQINPDPVFELSRRLQMWASVPDADGGALSPSAAIVPDQTIIAVLDEITKLKSQLEEARRENGRLEKLVYVPGLWRCPKCEFQLIQANLNAGDGSVTARDQPGDKCPNCNSPLWRVTERDAGNKLIDDAERVCMEASARLEEARAKAIEECLQVAEYGAERTERDFANIQERAGAYAMAREISDVLRALLNGSAK